MKSIIGNELINFLNYAHDEYHAVDYLKRKLNENSFIELKEDEDFKLLPGLSYYIIRNGNSIIAFKIPKVLKEVKFNIVAAHTDSPVFKIKENPSLIDESYERIKVEGYGGMIISTFLDRPLSFSGRIILSKDNEIYSKLIDDDKATMIIPNVAIHQNREINTTFQYNIQNDLNALFSCNNDVHFLDYITKFCDENEKIIGYDLNLYLREKASYVGMDDEFISGPKLDDLASLYGGFAGFLKSNPINSIPVMVGFYNEETGSSSYSGADSDFLTNTLRRISNRFDSSYQSYEKAMKKSFLISADNAHAIHPNHPEKSDNKNKCYLNKGIVLKFNSSMNYTTDALSGSLIKKINEMINLPTQIFFNRSDVRGGGTLGSISMSHSSILSCDIGLPQLAMHSAFETMGSEDIIYMVSLIETFMSLDLKISDGTIKITTTNKIKNKVL